MRKNFDFLNSTGMPLNINQTVVDSKTGGGDVPVEARTSVEPVREEKNDSFNPALSAPYADGTAISGKRRVLGNSPSAARIEFPSVNTFGGKPFVFYLRRWKSQGGVPSFKK